MLVTGDLSTNVSKFFLAHLQGQIFVEIFIRDHIAIGINRTKHYALSLIIYFLVVEDKNGEAVHVDAQAFVGKYLYTIVKVDHAELGDKLIIKVPQLERETGGLDGHLSLLLLDPA